MATKAIILHSGGLDSTVCLLKARKEGRDVISLGFDYGQRHRIELDYAAHQCVRFEVPRRVLRIEWHKPTLEMPIGRSVDEINVGGVSSAFLPGRNIVFLSLACADAAGVNASEIWIGINAKDFSGYPDCGPEFLEAYRHMTESGMPGGPEIVAPLLNLTKPEIAKLASELGLSESDTWSCYKPQYSTNGITPCRSCDACKLNSYAWTEIE